MNGELQQSGDRWRLVFARRLDHPPEKVWRAITEPAHLEAWFPQRIVGEWKVGSPLRFESSAGPPHGFDGEVLAFEEHALVEFRWGTDTIRLEIAPEDGGCLLTLTDTFDEVGKAARDAAGWHTCLDQLEHELDGSAPSWNSTERWQEVHPGYVERLGPEASAIGPPQGHPAAGGASASGRDEPLVREQHRPAGLRSALDLEHQPLDRDATRSREPAERAVGSQDAMARDDHRPRVAGHRDAHRLGGTRLPEPAGQFAVGDGLARWDRAGRLVDAKAEIVYAFHVQSDRREVAALPLQHGGDVLDRGPDLGRWGGLGGDQPFFSWKEDARRAALAPGDAADADRRIKQSSSGGPHHGDGSTAAGRVDGLRRTPLLSTKTRML